AERRQHWHGRWRSPPWWPPTPVRRRQEGDRSWIGRWVVMRRPGISRVSRQASRAGEPWRSARSCSGAPSVEPSSGLGENTERLAVSELLAVNPMAPLDLPVLLRSAWLDVAMAHVALDHGEHEG